MLPQAGGILQLLGKPTGDWKGKGPRAGSPQWPCTNGQGHRRLRAVLSSTGAGGLACLAPAQPQHIPECLVSQAREGFYLPDFCLASSALCPEQEEFY